MRPFQRNYTNCAVPKHTPYKYHESEEQKRFTLVQVFIPPYFATGKRERYPTYLVPRLGILPLRISLMCSCGVISVEEIRYDFTSRGRYTARLL